MGCLAWVCRELAKAVPSLRPPLRVCHGVPPSAARSVTLQVYLDLSNAQQTSSAFLRCLFGNARYNSPRSWRLGTFGRCFANSTLKPTQPRVARLFACPDSTQSFGGHPCHHRVPSPGSSRSNPGCEQVVRGSASIAWPSSFAWADQSDRYWTKPKSYRRIDKSNSIGHTTPKPILSLHNHRSIRPTTREAHSIVFKVARCVCFRPTLGTCQGH